MENLNDQEAEELMNYYREKLVSAYFNEDHTILNVIISNDSDLDKALRGVEISWYDKGEYPSSFTCVVTTEDGKQSGSFEYMGTEEIVPDMQVDEYDALIDFKDFWQDDVAKKFNAEKEVEFIVQDGIDVMKASKLIFNYINESTKLGSDITVILIDSKGKRTNLLVPANQNNL